MILSFRQHDRDLLVWGVATPHPGATITVRAYRAHREAEAAAHAAGRQTFLLVDRVDGTPERLICSPLVYHHADSGWTFVATGRSIEPDPRDQHGSTQSA